MHFLVYILPPAIAVCIDSEDVDHVKPDKIIINFCFYSSRLSFDIQHTENKNIRLVQYMQSIVTYTLVPVVQAHKTCT